MINTKIYLKKSDARCEAEKMACEINGSVPSRLSSVSNNNDFDYVDRSVSSINWSGETSAFQVLGEDYNLVALIGFLEEG